MRLSLSEISTVGASFHEDVAAYAAAGFDGIGLWEFKLPPDDDSNRALLAEHGLAAAHCVPAVPSFLQLGIPGMEGPADPAERVDALCASVRRLAGYDPACIVCLTGPLGGHGEAEGRAIVVEGLRRVAAVAREAGVPLGLEPIHPTQREIVSFANSIEDTVRLLDEAGLQDVGIMLDLYHSADDPALWDLIGRATYRIAGVHVADRPAEPGRSDRVLPGEGVLPLAEIVDALELSGWDGFLDIEIFSETGRFWGLPVEEAARRAHAAVAALPDGT
jgi:sugar phosphate isomerase/epimerase